MASSERLLSQLLCKIQTCDEGHGNTLLEHLKQLLMVMMESGDHPVDTALLSVALKRKALQHSRHDSFLPVKSDKDVSQLLKALALFG
jgi:hypothetical protein